jgi:AraC-like DNA-binding protein
MREILQLKTINDLFQFLQYGSTKHPLIGIVDFDFFNGHGSDKVVLRTDFYSVIFKKGGSNYLRYGRRSIDFQEGSLVCIGPQQLISIEREDEPNDQMKGWGLFFHPDFIRNSHLNQSMKEYSFFSYERSEALHLSEKEKSSLEVCLSGIQHELNQNIDHFSQSIIISSLGLFLNYCLRFYGRQFLTRNYENGEVVQRVHRILQDYFNERDSLDRKLPQVKDLAKQLHFSPSYLSDLLKKETGWNAQDHIHYALIEKAKNILVQSNLSIGEIAHELGFEYPQYFSRLFKQKTGFTPLEFRSHSFFE